MARLCRVQEREFARETALSDDPARIVGSNPSEYAWHSPYIAAKVRKRFEDFGDVGYLFLNPATRHLTMLTVPAQKLSRMLGRSSESDRVECELRQREFDRRCKLDIRTVSDSGIDRRLFSKPGITRERIERQFVEMALARATRHLSGGRQHGSLTFAPGAGTESYPQGLRIELRLEVKPDDFHRSMRGSLYVNACMRAVASPGQWPHEVKWLILGRLLPDQFRGYSRFASKEEIALCFSAWLHVSTCLADWLLNDGWIPVP